MICPECGVTYEQRGARGPVPKFCSTRCYKRDWAARQPKPEPKPRPPKQTPEECRRRNAAGTRAWRLRNLDRIKKYRTENRDLINATARRWSAANPDKVKAARRRDYAKNRERYIANTAKWQRENRERHSENTRRHHRLRYISKHTEDYAYVEQLAGDPCCYCGETMREIDHIVPISAGGPNQWDNLTASCKPCNASKRDKPLLIYLIDRQETTV